MSLKSLKMMQPTWGTWVLVVRACITRYLAAWHRTLSGISVARSKGNDQLRGGAELIIGLAQLPLLQTSPRLEVHSRPLSMTVTLLATYLEFTYAYRLEWKLWKTGRWTWLNHVEFFFTLVKGPECSEKLSKRNLGVFISVKVLHQVEN